MASDAPLLDLQAVELMRLYREHDGEVANQCLESIARHPWYLCQETVVFCLVDDKVSLDEKRQVALALLDVEKDVKESTFVPGKPSFPKVTGDEYWDDMSTERPSLTEFVGPRSWLAFERLGLRTQEGAMDWIKIPSTEWIHMTGFRKFKDFVSNLTVVNDPAERGVKLVQEYVESSTNESLRQDLMIVVAEDRKKFPGASNKSELAKKC